VADPQLLQYISQQEHAGVRPEQIAQVLADRGYTQEQIAEALSEANRASIDPHIVSYVQEYARAGQTPAQIQQELVAQGYAPAQVRKAIIHYFGPGTLPKHHTIMFACIALLLVAGLGLLLHQTISTPTIEQPAQINPSEQIGIVLGIARDKGPQAAIKECQVRLRNRDRDLCIMDVAILDSVHNDQLCDQIVDVSVRDTCLMNFLDSTPSVCKRVQLRENLETCQLIGSLRT